MKELFCVESGLDPRSFQKNEGGGVLFRIIICLVGTSLYEPVHCVGI
jgi:hypothetical protein